MRHIYLFSISSHPDAISVNSLDITLLKPQIDFSQYDYLIITSKQASKALQQYKKNDYLGKPSLCISKQSAKSFEELGGQVLSVGEGYGDSLAEKINSFPKEKRWLYLRAKVVASDFVLTCKEDGYMIDEKIVYESSCSEPIDTVNVEEDAILIFTSPSSVKCFLKKHELKRTQTIIIIGKTTAQALPGDCTYMLSNDRTIESCMQIANSLK